jgi:hypothetical protein
MRCADSTGLAIGESRTSGILKGLPYPSSGTDASRSVLSAVRIPWRISDQLCDGLEDNESCDATLHVRALPPPTLFA